MTPIDFIEGLATWAFPVLFAITMHEMAHGFMAKKLGDDTAYTLGRVTLNPVAHIDLIGTILIPLVLFVISGGSFVFGYAKPVPVRFGRLRKPKRDMIWVALAGPVCNLIQAIIWQILLYLVIASGLTEEPIFIGMCKAGVLINLVMFALNLFPIPPLDGGRVLAGLLPIKSSLALSKLEPYGFFIVLILVFTNVLTQFWMSPITYFMLQLIAFILTPLAKLLGLPF